MVNYKRILKTSLNLFIYKVNRASTEDLSNNTTLTEEVIAIAIEKTGDNMDEDSVSTRMRLKEALRYRNYQLA